jgi:hypothetical protein
MEQVDTLSLITLHEMKLSNAPYFGPGQNFKKGQLEEVAKCWNENAHRFNGPPNDIVRNETKVISKVEPIARQSQPSIPPPTIQMTPAATPKPPASQPSQAPKNEQPRRTFWLYGAFAAAIAAALALLRFKNRGGRRDAQN